MSKKPVLNVVSVSGGKDSTALALLACERGVRDLKFVFADTGHEHPLTYEYVSYLDGVLREKCGVGIQSVRADFSAEIERKREFIRQHWEERGVPQERIERALAVLKPTGIPFLDLCLWKGRFPSTKARFCTQELKIHPINAQVIKPAVREYEAVISWQGVRADESAARAALSERDVELGSWEPQPIGLLTYRPILRWSVEEVFAMHRRHDVNPNPLYSLGMGRVGCMPCINCRKDELLEISRRFPDEIARVAEWEHLVAEVSKRGCSTFFSTRDIHPGVADGDITHEQHGIRSAVEWAKTARGGRQYDLVRMQDDAPLCSSIYGLCE